MSAVLKPKGGPLARLAAQFCRQREFWEFCSRHPGYDTHVHSEESAKELILSECRIQSRAELDNNNEAARLFHSQVRIPYLEFTECGTRHLR